MGKAKLDPLLAALIAKLPPQSTAWSDTQQLAWLNLMAMAFGSVYGGQVSAKLGTAPLLQTAPPVVAPSTPKPAPKKANYPFLIDEAGYARNAKGKRITAGEVTDVLYDLRGIDGDVNGIIWADDSIGLNGSDLTIAVA
jgi:hypothetical protein